MTRINYELKNGYYKQITIKGHANFADLGKDIVCASISSIAITSINAILRFDHKSVVIDEKDGFLKIDINKQDELTNILLINMMELLIDLEKQYPKNLEIRKMV